MDVIANIVSVVLTFVAGIIGNIVAHDVCTTADARCAKIIGRAAKRLAPFDIEATELEWLADLAERETVREKYRHAIGCYLAAPRMRRQAQTVTISIKFKVNSVGEVPLRIAIDPIFGTRLLNALGKQSVLSKPLWLMIGIYQFSKVMVAAHRLGPGRLQRFVKEFANFKKWDFDVKAGRKGLMMDFSKILKLYAIDRQAGIKYLKEYVEILTKPNGVKPPQP
jgi:hypothetical protein